MKIQYSGICDIGLKAKENQDRIVCLTDDQCGLFAVADGMGGLANGSFASETIRQELESWWRHYNEETSPIDAEKSGTESLRKALSRANDKIIQGTPAGTRCGSTVVALLLEEDRYSVISCGDSRCYRAEKGFLTTRTECLTKDDVWENTESNVRNLSPEEVRRHRNRGKLVRAVGTGNVFSCSVKTGRISSKQVFLLCSDGMHKRVPGDEVEKSLKKVITADQEELNRVCDSLKKTVYKNGAGDNISIIIVSVDRSRKGGVSLHG